MSSFKELIKQISDEQKPSEAYDQEAYSNLEHDADLLPMPDDIANLILMHRNAHFGSKFSFMLDYYKNEGIGCCSDFDVKSIEKLAEIESKLGVDIAPARLSATENEQVNNVLSMYKGLRKLHSLSQDSSSIPTLLSDLILTEEASPDKEINELSDNEKALPYLLDILKTDEFLDPLFPGYGRTPSHIAKILGKMKTQKAIVPLFESMKAEHFNHEEAVICALKDIGSEAFDFLIQVLQNEPINSDNEKAAICLTHFEENEVFAKACLNMLLNFQSLNFPNLVVHLILGCLGLKEASEIEQFLTLKNQLPQMYAPDFRYVSTTVKKKLKNSIS